MIAPTAATAAVPNSDAPADKAVTQEAVRGREEIRKERDLEEARKKGLAPAEKDEDGKDINPHIPQYIAKAPWYLSLDHPSLKHQRFKPEDNIDIHQWYKRGLKAEKATKFRKGACANCGASTHESVDCSERPRRRGAILTGVKIAPDEFIEAPDTVITWDGKRDPWNGYNPESYREVMRDHDIADLERKKRKVKELNDKIGSAKSQKKAKKLVEKKLKILRKAVEVESKDASEGVEGGGETGGDGGRKAKDGGGGGADGKEDSDSDSDGNTSDSDSEADSDDDDEGARIRDFDQTNAVVGTKDDRTRTTTRNLRIREDTAKYLINLDVSSAHYDPKTRSMRENPLKDAKEDDQWLFKGDNAVRGTGDAPGVSTMEMFAWNAYLRQSNLHFQAQPTQLEKMHEGYFRKQKGQQEERKEQLFSRYGGREHDGGMNSEVMFSQTEAYTEYAKDGTIIRGREKVMARSKYEEDVCEYGHSSVWGSWYDRETDRWGYACCKSGQRMRECEKALVKT
eukprot:GHVU01225102.1.p1 GENE.GHVU01225102.1~~GHVU01225102.1.p1  ORF type:complete len:512 (+),score=134.16 GHVU01225102.1:104-1639(+)